jgi:putative tricarboxylic transport membrane protein
LKVHDALSGAGLAALGAVVLWHIQGFPAMPGQKFGPAWFPGLIAAGLVLCGTLLVVQGLRRTARAQPWIALPAWTRKPRPLASVAAVLGGLLFYVLAADRLGFHLTGVLLLTVWARLLGASWRMSAAVALIATFAIHLSFYKLLRIPLPWGIFERFAF